MYLGAGVLSEYHLLSGIYTIMSDTLQSSSAHNLSNVLVLMFFPERSRCIESGVMPYPMSWYVEILCSCMYLHILADLLESEFWRDYTYSQ